MDVWLGTEPSLASEQIVGIRLLLEGLAPSVRLVVLKRFERRYCESRRLGKSFPDLFPRIYPGLRRTSQSAWIMMEKFEGDLSSLPEMGWKKAAEKLSSPLAALAILHQQGLYHRDVKPSNMLRAGNSVVLSDLGVLGSMGGFSQLTPTGSILGTPLYLHTSLFNSPKVGSPVTADIYAWFVSWFEIANGGLPIEIDGYPVIIADIAAGRYGQYLFSLTPQKIQQLIIPLIYDDSSVKLTAVEVFHNILTIYPELEYKYKNSSIEMIYNGNLNNGEMILSE